MPSTIVIGAGWAGLKCAYTLTKAGHQVTLIDAAPQTGGRARAVPFQHYTVDNGQHICLGAYHTLREVLCELKLDENQLFHILPMELIARGKQTFHLKLANLPAPFNLLYGLLNARNIPWLEKYQTLKFCYRLQRNNFYLQQDCSVFDLLTAYQQSDFIIKNLWEPLALAAMTTPINIASAQVFLNILRQSFSQNTTDSHWYLPAKDLSALFPQHIERYLQQNGSRVVCAQAVKKLHIAQDRCVSASSNLHTWQADDIVLAMPPWQATMLLKEHPMLHTTYAALSMFSYQPITTIYLEFAAPVTLPYPMYGILDGTSHWVFDRRFISQPNIISVVISGPGAHQQLSHTELFNAVINELNAHFACLPALVNYRVINEKRAAFTCDVVAQKYRPTPATSIKNLWLTGDYLSTGLPATLEGALLSGKRTAESIIARHS